MGMSSAPTTTSISRFSFSFQKGTDPITQLAFARGVTATMLQHLVSQEKKEGGGGVEGKGRSQTCVC